MDKIDIILATYNGENYIREQIDSIINQTYGNWNLTIRDDGSKDKTVSIIKEYTLKDKRISLIEDNEGNVGYNKNFEVLLGLAKSEYIMFCDQDDIWLNNKIEISLNEIKKLGGKNNTTPLLVFTQSELFNNKGERLGLHIRQSYKKIKTANILVGLNICQGATIIVNKKMKEYVLPFNSDYVYDYYLFLMAELAGKWKYIDQPTMLYRIHDKNQIGIGEKRNKGFIDKAKKEYYIYPVIYKKIKDNVKLIKKMEISNNKTVDDFTRVFSGKESRIVKLILLFQKRYFTKKFLINIFFVLNILVNGYEESIQKETIKILKILKRIYYREI